MVSQLVQITLTSLELWSIEHLPSYQILRLGSHVDSALKRVKGHSFDCSTTSAQVACMSRPVISGMSDTCVGRSKTMQGVFRVFPV